jgi:hypothetical protein
MAWCPFAVHKPITKNRSAITPRAIIAHTAVSGATSLYGYFSGVGDDSHFYIDGTGRIEQYVDTTRSAYANRNANGFAVSIETWDNRDPAHTPWTAAQVASLIRLNSWLAATHPTIPRRQITDPYGAGLGWHAMFGAPSAWTSAVGKTCPGAPRIQQMKTTIIPAFIGGNSGGGSSPAPEIEEDDMSSDRGEATPEGQWGRLHVPVNGGRYLRIASSYGDKVKIDGITMIDDTPPGMGTTNGRTVSSATRVDPDRPGPWDLAATDPNYANYSHLVIRYQCPGPVKAWINNRP